MVSFGRLRLGLCLNGLILATHRLEQTATCSVHAVAVVRCEISGSALSSVPEILYSGDQTAHSETIVLNRSDSIITAYSQSDSTKA
jgi:hypothetical protein